MEPVAGAFVFGSCARLVCTSFSAASAGAVVSSSRSGRGAHLALVDAVRGLPSIVFSPTQRRPTVPSSTFTASRELAAARVERRLTLWRPVPVAVGRCLGGNATCSAGWQRLHGAGDAPHSHGARQSRECLRRAVGLRASAHRPRWSLGPRWPCVSVDRDRPNPRPTCWRHARSRSWSPFLIAFGSRDSAACLQSCRCTGVESKLECCASSSRWPPRPMAAERRSNDIHVGPSTSRLATSNRSHSLGL